MEVIQLIATITTMSGREEDITSPLVRSFRKYKKKGGGASEVCRE